MWHISDDSGYLNWFCIFNLYINALIKSSFVYRRKFRNSLIKPVSTCFKPKCAWMQREIGPVNSNQLIQHNLLYANTALTSLMPPHYPRPAVYVAACLRGQFMVIQYRNTWRVFFECCVQLPTGWHNTDTSRYKIKSHRNKSHALISYHLARWGLQVDTLSNKAMSIF